MSPLNTQEKNKETSPVHIALAWLFVSIPLVWGVAKVVIKTAALFN